MYSDSITERVLDDFERDLHEQHKKDKSIEVWRPKMKSIAQVDELIAYLDSITDMESNSVNKYYSWKPGKRPYPRRIEWIKRQVLNEQYCCFASAEYFVTRYGRIRNIKEEILRVEYRKAQVIFHKLLADYDERQIAIQLFFLKARQVGVSTIVALYFLHRILFRSNTHAVMASARTQQSEKLGMMIETCAIRLPWWLGPEKKSIKALEPRWENGSALSVQAGSQEVGIAQGSTPTCLHLSEIGDYVAPKKTIEEGLFPAAHQTSALFFVLEGTGSTASPWQKEKWTYYKENWGKGGRFQPIFIPPCCAPDIYPTSDWLRANPIRENWIPMTETLRMKHRAELFVRSTDYLAVEMGARWEMGREYMWSWECGYREAVASHSEKTFLSQNAVTDDDAFQSKFDSVFSDETIHIVSTEREQNYRAYAITGKTILMGQENHPYTPRAEEIDWNMPIIPLQWEANDGITYHWELVPLLSFDDSSDEACFDKLLVFEEPFTGDDTAIGIDTADGLNMPNEDRSYVSVHRGEWGRDRDNQKASFTSIRVNPAQMGRIAAAIGVYFTTDGFGTITGSNPLGPKFIIEQTRKAGDDAQLALKIMGFYDHHGMIRYDNRGPVIESGAHKEGWFTSKWSRPFLLNNFVDAVTTGWLKVNCPVLIRQLKTFIRKEKAGMSEMIHEVGDHDDAIFGAAMAWLRLHHLDNKAERLSRRYQAPIPIDTSSDSFWADNSVQID